jgi:hypothetical protein
MPPRANTIIEKIDARSSNSHRWALIVIVLAGFVVRFYALFAGEGYRYFGIQDEVFAFSKVLQFLAGDGTALAMGQPIIPGVFTPGAAWPLFCLALVKLGGGTVSGALVWMTLLTSLVTYLVYLLALHFTSPRGALLSALLFALSPWAVYYSFGLWNPVPMALLGAILFLTLWNAIVRDRSAQIFWVCLMAAIMPQFHMIAIFYLPAILLLVLVSPARIHRGWFFLGAMAGIAFYLPYLMQEIANHGANTRLILAGEKPHSLGVLRLLTAPVTVLSNVQSRWLGGGTAEFKTFGNRYFGSVVILALLNLASIVNAVAFFAPLFRKAGHQMRSGMGSLRGRFREDPRTFFITVLLVVPSLFFILTRHSYNSRYAIVLLPLLCLLPPLFLRSLQRPRVKRFFTVNIAIMIAANLYLILGFFYYQSQLLRTGPVFLPSFEKMESALRALQADAGPERRVQLDVQEFYNTASASPGTPWFIAAHSLSTYVNNRSVYVPKAERDRPFVVYTMHLTGDRSLAAKRIVVQKNGMVIVRSDDQ